MIPFAFITLNKKAFQVPYICGFLTIECARTKVDVSIPVFLKGFIISSMNSKAKTHERIKIMSFVPLRDMSILVGAGIDELVILAVVIDFSRKISRHVIYTV